MYVVICSVFWLLPIHVVVLSKAKSFHCYAIFLILFQPHNVTSSLYIKVLKPCNGTVLGHNWYDSLGHYTVIVIGWFLALLFSTNCHQKYVIPWLTSKSELLDSFVYYSVQTIIKSTDFWAYYSVIWNG